MVGKDPRRSAAEKAILGFLAWHYSSPGSTYREVVEGISQGPQSKPKKKGLGIRQVKRYLPEFQKDNWVRNKLVGVSQRFSITPHGYFHYHKALGHDVTSLESLSEGLLSPLMAKGIWRLTQDQARYFKEYLGQTGSLLVLLPAGAGKTVIATAEAYQHYQRASSDGAKVLYLSPYKAINSQSIAEFQRVLTPLGMLVVRQDGDHHAPFDELLKANLVVSTFESAQFSLYRGDKWIQQVDLVIVDELSVLDATRDRKLGGLKLSRGANLDFLITSFLHSARVMGKRVRFVCLGIPNASQPALQKWLGEKTTMLEPSQRFDRCEEKVAVFEKRGSGQEWYIERKDGVRSEGLYDAIATGEMQRVLIVVVHYLRKLYESSKNQAVKPILVFVRTPEDASEGATRLERMITKDPVLAGAMRKGRSANSYTIRHNVVIPTPTVKQLSNIVNSGIGFHHAGLFHDQRRLVEKMMEEQCLSVVFATTTLTHGVDFPVGAVIIDERLLDMLGYSRLEYLQLKGRVDHKDPFHESHGMADAVVVMSREKTPGSYERVRELLHGVDPPLDSQSLAVQNARAFLFRAIQYLTCRLEDFGPEQLETFAGHTYYVQQSLQQTRSSGSDVLLDVKKQSDLLARWCEQQGLIRRTVKGIEVQELAKVADQTGLGFFDIVRVSGRIRKLRGFSGDGLTVRLLSLALSLVQNSDEVGTAVRRVNLDDKGSKKLLTEAESFGSSIGGVRQGLLIAIIYKWMEERPISEIAIDKPELQIYASDLLISMRAVARNLRTIAHAIELIGRKKGGGPPESDYFNIAETARLLAVRVRYGVSQDLASAELGSVGSMVFIDDLVNSIGYPEFLMRIVLRLLMKKGWSTGAKLREYRGKKPITAADLRDYSVDRETADSLKIHRDELNGVAMRIVEVAKSGHL